jgi:hypothetical protein
MYILIQQECLQFREAIEIEVKLRHTASRPICFNAGTSFRAHDQILTFNPFIRLFIDPELEDPL